MNIQRLNRDENKCQPGIKGFFYWWLESTKNNYRWIVDLSLMFVILVSVFIIVAEITIEPKVNLIYTWINLVCLAIFMTEYLLRFWINTDFLYDIKENSLIVAIKNKLLWVLRPMSIIDFLSIIPTLPALRSFRLFRMIRLMRLLRLLKIGRYVGGGSFVREIKKRSFEILLVILVTSAIISFSAVLLFCIEKPAGNENIKTIFDAIWWAIVTSTTVGYGDIFPITPMGRIVAIFPMFAGVGMAGAMTAIITGMIIDRIEAMKAGKIIQANQSNHILFCGWNSCAKQVVNILEGTGYFSEKQLVVLSENANPDRDDTIFIKGNKNNINALLRANADKASDIIIFREAASSQQFKTADHENLLSAIQNRSLNTTSDANITVELTFPQKTNFIQTHLPDTECIHKESIDAAIILNTIRNEGHTTEILYDLASVNGNRFESIKANILMDTVNDADSFSVRDIKLHLIEKENKASCFLIAYKPFGLTEWILNPKNNQTVKANDELCIVREENTCDN